MTIDGEALARAALARLAEDDRRRAAMRRTFLEALPVARDAGLSAVEVGDAWSIPGWFIRRETDRLHKARSR